MDSEIFPKPDIPAKGPTKLVEASGKGDITEVRSILRKFPDKVNITHGGSTALHQAAYYDHIEIVKYLTSHDANVDFTDYKKKTSLHYAVDGNHVDIVRHLLETKASTTMVDIDGKTPLQIAQDRNYKDCIELFHDSEFNHEIPVKIPETRPKILCAANLGAAHAKKNNGCIGGCGTQECVTFNPCGHNILCLECVGKKLKCQQCKKLIENITFDPRSRHFKALVHDIVRLRKENEELKTQIKCDLCNEGKKDCLLEECHHVFCSSCVDKLMKKTMPSCPNCRKPITEKKKIFI